MERVKVQNFIVHILYETLSGILVVNSEQDLHAFTIVHITIVVCKNNFIKGKKVTFFTWETKLFLKSGKIDHFS
jgi:hypothetical protein